MGTVKRVALSFLAAAFIVLLSWQTFFSQVNDIGYDFILRLAGPVTPSDDVLIVAIDEESLGQIGAWQWPRGVLAELLVEVLAGEPASVGVDLLLDDATDAVDDGAMSAVLSRADAVVLAARVDEVGGVTRWRLPLASFLFPDTLLGHVHADPDLDGVLRRIVTAKHAEGRLVNAFAIELLKAARRLPAGFEEDLGGAVRVEPDEFRIRFSGDRGRFDTVSAWEVLEGVVPATRFAGRVVLVGATAEGLGDQWMTPFSLAGRPMSGIEVHANAIDTMLSGREIRSVPDGVVLILAALLILALWGAESRFEGGRFYAIGVGALPLLVGLAWAFMRFGNWWLPFPTLMFTVALAVPALGVGKLVRVNRDLDRKLERMATGTRPHPADPDAVALYGEIDAVSDDQARREWRRSVGEYAQRHSRLESERARAHGQHRNAPRKLDAVEFFNSEMARLVSFNDAVLGGIDDVLVVSDPAGNVVYQNPATRRLAAYADPAPRLWHYLDRLVEREDGAGIHDTTREAFAQTFVSDEPVVFPVLRERIDARGPASSRYFTLTLSGIADIGVLASLHDITARRELDQAKNDTVSLVSHELRTPLTSIRGFAEMLGTYDLVAEKGRRFLTSIMRESDRLDRLIQTFLDIAAIESGGRKPEFSDVDPDSMMADLAESHRAAAALKQMTIHVRSSPGSRVISADRTLIHQAVSNLIANAIKYSPAGTTVTVERIDADDEIGFSVSDEGHGIPPDELGHVFQKFYRRSNRETRGETGFGLGLAFVRQVAELHGGRIEVESRVGSGSTFVLILPQEAGGAGRMEPASP